MRRRRPVRLSWRVVVASTAGVRQAAWAAKKTSPTTTTTTGPGDPGPGAAGAGGGGLGPGGRPPRARSPTSSPPRRPRRRGVGPHQADRRRPAPPRRRRAHPAAGRGRQQEVAVRSWSRPRPRSTPPATAMNQTVTAMYRRGTSEEQAVYVSILEEATNPNELLLGPALRGRHDQARPPGDLDHFLALQEDGRPAAPRGRARAEEIRVTRDQQVAERDRLRGPQGRGAGQPGGGPQVGGGPPAGAARAGPGPEGRLPVGSCTPLQVESGAVGEFLRQVQAGQKLAPRKKRTFRAPVQAPMSQRVRPPGPPDLRGHPHAHRPRLRRRRRALPSTPPGPASSSGPGPGAATATSWSSTTATGWPRSTPTSPGDDG